MADVFDRLSSADVLPIVIVSIIFGSILLISLTAIIASCVYKTRRLETAARLKQDMLDRGMSADEIKAVLDAGPKE
jgi:hypothetical protein